MRLVLIIEYAIYLFFLCDVRLGKPFLSEHSLVWGGYGILLVVQELVACFSMIKNNDGKIIRPNIVKYMFIILLWTVLEGFNKNTDNGEYIVLLGFILSVFLTGLQFARYSAIRELFLISYIVPNILLILNTVINKIDLFGNLRYLNLTTFFSTIFSQRIRFNLGFSNPNIIGNLVTCLLCISIPMLNVWKKSYWYKRIAVITIILNICDFLMLLECGSRTGAISFLVCIFLYIFLVSTDNTSKNFQKRKWIRLISLFFIIIGCSVLFLDTLFYAYILGRGHSFESFRLLNGIHIVTGLGVFPPNEIIRIYRSHLDNYYIYILLTTGVLGLSFYLCFFVKLFCLICSYRKDKVTYGIISCFIAHMLYGFGETCILYPMFASSAIYIAIFICYSIIGNGIVSRGNLIKN